MVERVSGSSPLTRGKLVRSAGTSRADRLIPAHAGKTRRYTSPGVVAWAHPRSRGENARPWCPRHSPAGSSPLTRGKPHHLTLARALLRLIPAHAGKTATGQATFRRLAAHPRSRGENSLFRRAREPCGGSSPLTRGKLPALPAPDPFPGLIPAHAGKTRIATSVCSLSTAHPRSRGENVSHASDALLIWGSSPLTRGKRSDSLHRVSPFWAHPRSRGENISTRLIVELR